MYEYSPLLCGWYVLGRNIGYQISSNTHTCEGWIRLQKIWCWWWRVEHTEMPWDAGIPNERKKSATTVHCTVRNITYFYKSIRKRINVHKTPIQAMTEWASEQRKRKQYPCARSWCVRFNIPNGSVELGWRDAVVCVRAHTEQSNTQREAQREE